MLIKVIFIVSFLLMKGFDFYMDMLNDRHNEEELPENVRDVYDQKEYDNWRRYSREKGKVSMVKDLISLTLILFFLICNVHAKVFDLFSGYNIYVRYFICIMIFMGINLLVSLPHSYYSTFVIEEKYGMNKTTKQTFFLDTVKAFLIGAVLNSLLVFLIMYLFENFGNSAILWGSIIFTVISILIAQIVVPLMRIFNKFTPLEEGELKDKLLKLCDKYHVQIKKIVVRDASRRTTKANAFCTGLKKKTISLDDNLVNEFSTDQIVAVFSHEFGHAKFKHVLKSLPFGILTIFINFGFCALFLNTKAIFTAFGFTGINYYFMLEYVELINWPFLKLSELISNYLSRKFEYEADAFAAREGYGEDLISALKKLVKESLSDINPHPWEIALNYSHPTLSMRIDAIRSID